MTFSYRELVPKPAFHRTLLLLSILLIVACITLLHRSKLLTSPENNGDDAANKIVNIAGPANDSNMPGREVWDVVISSDRMNFLYLGIENPVTIAAPGRAASVKATLTNGEMKRVAGNHWAAIPHMSGEQTIYVTADGKKTPMRFLVKDIPEPALFVGVKRGGIMSKDEFKAMGGIIARSIDPWYECDCPFRVVSFHLIAAGCNLPDTVGADNVGNRWSGKVKEIIDNATPGTTIFIDNVKTIGSDNVEREFRQKMIFLLK